MRNPLSLSSTYGMLRKASFVCRPFGQNLIKSCTIAPIQPIHRKSIHAQRLEDRTVIKVTGSDAAAFLQGLMTNDIRHLEEEANIMYCMFLNTQGRVLYDSLIIKGEEHQSYLIDCDSRGAHQLAKHLTMYRVRRKVSVAIEDSLETWVLFESPPKDLNEKFILAKDPRVKELGWRLLATSKTDLHQHIKDLKIAETNFYQELRFRLGVGEGTDDLPPGKSFPLECNCDYLHGISFHKGCYIGQELTARTYHTGVVRKRLMPVKFRQTPPESLMPDAVVTSETNDRVGRLRSIIPGSVFALGLLRVQEASTSLLKVGSCSVTTHKPDWWPIEAPKQLKNLTK